MGLMMFDIKLITIIINIRIILKKRLFSILDYMKMFLYGRWSIKKCYIKVLKYT